MRNQDQIIRHVVACINNHGDTVRDAFNAVLVAQNHDTLPRLRAALMAQAEGFEPVAANGATHQARKEAARLALEAWDAPAEPESGDKREWYVDAYSPSSNPLRDTPLGESGPFSTQEAAQKFAQGLAQSGRATRVDISAR